MSRRFRLLLSWALPGLLVCAVLLTPGRASAAVTYIGPSTCSTASMAFFAPWSLTVPRPANSQVGDLLVMTLSLDVFSFWDAADPPAGWTSLQSDGQSAVFYKWHGAGEPANYTIVSFVGGTNGSGSASISPFRGVDPAAPFVTPLPARTTGTDNSAELPVPTATRADSMRFAAVNNEGNRAANAWTGGLTEAADCRVGNSGTAAARAVQGVGPAPAATATLSGAATWVGHSFIIQPPAACGAGGLTLTAQPATVTFPATALNGLNQTQPGLASFTVNDQQPLHPGWNLSATSTTFNNGAGGLLPTNATTVTGGSATAAVGNCSLPTNGIAYPLTLPAAAVAPAAVKIFNAAATTGAGPSNIDSALSLLVPSNARTGTYVSTWTFTLATGP